MGAETSLSSSGVRVCPVADLRMARVLREKVPRLASWPEASAT